MTVAQDSWGECDGSPRHSSRRSKAAVASAGTGLQVVAVLFAVRVGYKLARSAGRIIFDSNAPSESSISQDEQQQRLEDFGEQDGVASAREQWVQCADPAPEPPEGARLMASEHLPISVYHFYEQFMSVEAGCLQDHHRSTGQIDFRSTKWKGDGAGHFSRVFDFVQPKKGVCSSNARCSQQQVFSVHAGGVFVMTTDMSMTGIPYADAFRVMTFWKAAPDATGLGCSVSIYASVPFSKRCLVKGIILGTTFKDCQTFFSDFLAKVQNSIATELLPAAAAQAAAAEQLLGNSPAAAGAAAAAALSTHLSQAPPLHAPRTPRQLGAPAAAAAAAPSALSSPFAAVDAEVFVSTPLQAGGSAPQRKHGGKAAAGPGWFHWPKHNNNNNKARQQQQQQPAAAHAADAAAAAAAAEGGDVLAGLMQHGDLHHLQQQLQQQQHGHLHQRQRHNHHHNQQQLQLQRQLPSRCPTPSRLMSRAVSVKPSFAVPIDDLRLPNRVRHAEVITTAQAILLLLVLVVQLISLYDSMAIRRLLAAAGPLAALEGGGGL